MDIERLSNICLDISTEWTDVQITYKDKRFKETNIVIPVMYTGSNGIFVFLNVEHSKDAGVILESLYQTFGIRDSVFLFFSSEEDNAFVYDEDKKRFLELEDLYDAFEIFYYNHYIPQAKLHLYAFKTLEDYFQVYELDDRRELDEGENEYRYVRPIISSQKLEKIEEKLEDILSSGRKEGKYIYYEDGTVSVRKIATNDNIYKPWVSYFSEARECEFPCMDEEGDRTFLRTVLGGFLGLHKFKAGNILQGILYFLTCGGCCLFYIIDMISMMLGNYANTTSEYFREDSGRIGKSTSKTFIRPIRNKKSFLLVPLSILVSITLLKYAYFPAYTFGIQLTSKFFTEIATEMILDTEAFSSMSEEELNDYLLQIEQAATEYDSENNN